MVEELIIPEKIEAPALFTLSILSLLIFLAMLPVPIFYAAEF
jgi:hypothetical protein